MRCLPKALGHRRRLAASALALLAAGAAATAAGAQVVLLEKGVRAAGLWCFPLAGAAGTYVYLPSQARLATDGEGRPRFSLIRYVTEKTSAPSARALEEAAGGGVLHFLVVYGTPEEAVAEARRELGRLTGRGEVDLRGPILFRRGRYTLVSSILGPSEARSGREVLASGGVPMLEGGAMALSFRLDPQRTDLLLASLSQPTSDVSISIDLAFVGQHPAYEAQLVVDWQRVSEHRSLDAGGTSYWISARVEKLFDELRRSGAIRLESAGTSQATQALVDRAYGRLLDLMFEPAVPAARPEPSGGLLDALAALFDPRQGLGAQKLLGWGGHLAYAAQELRAEGESVLSFRHRAEEERLHRLTFNLGDLYRRFGDDEDLFRTVSLTDPPFQQRSVHVAVDGALQEELGEAINHVAVTLRKRHGSGAETLRELVVYRESVAAALGGVGSSEGGPPGLRLIYGWNGDSDRTAWLDYDVRTAWSFRGGGTFRTPWRTQADPVIHLYAPFHRRAVQVLGDGAALTARGVRAISVHIDTPFFGRRRRQQLVLRPAAGPLDAKAEIVLPTGDFAYRYTLTWTLSDGRRLAASGTDDSGVILVDELPAAADPLEAPETAPRPEESS